MPRTQTQVPKSFQGQQTVMTQHDAYATREKDILQREEDIIKIAQSVNEINGLMKDTLVLVKEQGLIIDNIEANIEASEQNTKQGVVELGEANHHLRQTTCIIQ